MKKPKTTTAPIFLYPTINTSIESELLEHIQRVCGFYGWKEDNCSAEITTSFLIGYGWNTSAQIIHHEK